MRFSVIMPVYLGDYPGAAKDRIQKFIRAIDSLRKQEFVHPTNELAHNYEVIVVSHGCFESADIMSKEKAAWLKDNWKLIEVKRNCSHEGHTRQAGMEAATGEYIVFCDSDDLVGLDHLAKLDDALRKKKDPEFAYFGIMAFGGAQTMQLAKIKHKLQHKHVGNANIVFKRSLLEKGLSYDGLDGYGHDWKFIEEIKKHTRDKVDLGEKFRYFVCHLPNPDPTLPALLDV